VWTVTDRGEVQLCELTTLRTGGPVGRAVTVQTTEELVEAVRSADAAARPLLLVGDGSNLVAPDEGWDGDVVLIRNTSIEEVRRGEDIHLRVAAGHPWDELVADSVEAGWSGLECLSGIPGRTGATPVQNVAAYGQDVADSITSLEVYDRQSRQTSRWAAAACRFGYRDSRFKHTDRYVVLCVEFRLRGSGQSGPIRYPELATRLGVEVGEPAPRTDVRAAVLELRRSKGMVLDASDHDTWSAGSFFTNPILTPLAHEQFAGRASAHLGPGTPWPVYPDPRGHKLSAAWLIEQAGFAKGYARGPAALSSKHALALTNRGGATTGDILALAGEITDGVEQKFGVRLRPEPRILGK